MPSPHQDPAVDGQRIVAWYELVQDVYEAGQALSTLTRSAPIVDALLARAAALLGLEELALGAGSPPSKKPGQWVLPLSSAAAGVLDVQHQLYLRASLGGRPHDDNVLHLQLERLGRHLVRSMEIEARSSTEHHQIEALYQSLERLPVAVVLYDYRGRVRFKNRAGHRAQASHPHFAFWSADQTLARGCVDEPVAALFRRVRHNLQQGDCRTIQHCSTTHLLTLVPLLSSTASVAFAPDGPCLALFIQQRAWCQTAPNQGRAQAPQVPAALSRRLQERFLLTPSEARLCFALFAGLSLASYASIVGRSALTLRKQLKAAYRKLDVHDQKALILRVWLEQQAGWLECVTLFAAPPARGPAATLLYPTTTVGADPTGSVAQQASVDAVAEDPHVHV